MNLEENLALAIKVLPKELLNTLYMVFFAGLFGLILGLPLGVILTITDKGGLKESAWVNKSLGFLVNVGRSVPFAILIVAIFPLTRLLVGTSIGTTASIVPLSLAAAPFLARLIEGAFKEINPAVIEAAHVMGSTPTQIIQKVFS